MSLRSFIAVMAVLPLFACTPLYHGPVVPELRMSYIEPLQIEPGKVEVIQEYDPGADPKDVSARFAVPPHEALKRYVNKRFVAGEQLDTLIFKIKDARVHHRLIEQKNDMVRWAGLGQEDEYRLFLEIELMRRGTDGRLTGDGQILTLERTLIVPESASVAEREAKQIAFVEEMIADIDLSVTDALRDTLRVLP